MCRRTCSAHGRVSTVLNAGAFPHDSADLSPAGPGRMCSTVSTRPLHASELGGPVPTPRMRPRHRALRPPQAAGPSADRGGGWSGRARSRRRRTPWWARPPLHADANRHALRGEVLRVHDGDEALHPRAVHGVEDGPRGLGDIAVPAVLGHLPPADLQHRRLSPARGRNRLDHNEPDGDPRHCPPVVVGAAQLDEAEALNRMVRQAHEVLHYPGEEAARSRRGAPDRDRDQSPRAVPTARAARIHS